MRKGYRTVMFIGFVLFGILINVQLRSTLASNPNADTSAKEYAIELEKERNEGKRLMEQLAVKEAELEQLWQNLGTNSNNQEINELLRKRDFEYLRAGLTTVSGRGIVITMEDAPAKGELDVNEYIIHDGNINDVLEALKENGAQAISINGERVVFNTKPVCAGPTIIVNENRYPPPYVIEAIGDPDVLYDAIETLPQVAFMRLTDIRIQTEKKEEIIINRYRTYSSTESQLKGIEVIEK
ncbi:MAG: DUF881 domain-containing protein [Acetivibrionales bacterium]|jgi:uncharacterized protein YlxW (UPF0749 family)|nr:DUF881 domain-containing protein [Clostridiaceae bacterium]